MTAAPAARGSILALVAFLAASGPARAEDPAPAPAPGPEVASEARVWSVSLGTGAGGFVEFVSAFSSGGPGGYDTSRRGGRLQLNLRADRELTRSLRVGLAAVYDRFTESYFSGGLRTGSTDNDVYVLMADGTITWYRSRFVELYGGLAVGGGAWRQSGEGIASSQTGVQSGLAFQLRYFGINLGDERFRAFVDLGIGFEGLVVAGVSLRL